MMETKKRKVFRRGNGTIELPFLVSCAVRLLDLRFWVLGIRHPLHGIRFDLLGRVPAVTENLILVEAKYRDDGRPVRPYEVKRFAGEVARVKAAQPNCIVLAFFMTNAKISKQALEVARRHRIRTFQGVPLLFHQKEGREDEKSRSRREKPDTHAQHFSSSH